MYNSLKTKAKNYISNHKYEIVEKDVMNPENKSILFSITSFFILKNFLTIKNRTPVSINIVTVRAIKNKNLISIE